MPCFHPLTAYRAPPGKQIAGIYGDRPSFDPRLADIPGVQEIKLPCGQCIGCRLEKSRDWATRIVLEQKFHEESCFITLTYNDINLPPNRSLCQRDVTLFLKRLRKWVDEISPGKKIRYFYCGEYGGKTQRPHYHVCLFGMDFSDVDEKGCFKYKRFYKYTENGDILWISKELEKLWGKGFCPFGGLTFDSAAYTARYVLKKINGALAEDHYKGRNPEFICMSRMPGIGADFFKSFESDIYPKDFITIRQGIKCRPPEYYDRLFKKYHQDDRDRMELLSEIKSQRQIAAMAKAAELTDDRLAAMSEVTKIRSARLVRNLEESY